MCWCRQTRLYLRGSDRAQSDGRGADRVVPEGRIELNLRADGLVGRAAELQELADSLQAVARGSGRTVLIEGEPGIGKSTLLREIIEGAQRLGINVFSAAAEELERRRPFGVVSDCLGLFPTADRRRAEIARILHKTASLTTAGRDPLSGSPTTEFRFVEACLALVEDLATQGPLLIALDDLHWADRSSLIVVNRLAHLQGGQVPQLLAQLRGTGDDQGFDLIRGLTSGFDGTGSCHAKRPDRLDPALA